jgi:hypothetical protein
MIHFYLKFQFCSIISIISEGRVEVKTCSIVLSLFLSFFGVYNF